MFCKTHVCLCIKKTHDSKTAHTAVHYHANFNIHVYSHLFNMKNNICVFLCFVKHMFFMH